MPSICISKDRPLSTQTLQCENVENFQSDRFRIDSEVYYLIAQELLRLPTPQIYGSFFF